MRRREFLALLGGAIAARPLPVGAQQGSLPVIGVLDPRSPDALAGRLPGFRQGLRETGFIEGENLAVEYRWAENQSERLPEMATELVRRGVSAIVTPGGTGSALVAKSATKVIPVLFVVAGDPVKLGLVSSLAHPEANLTGVNFFAVELTGKRLEILRELLPTLERIAVLVNSTNPAAESTSNEVEAAARAMGVQAKIFNVGTSREINAVFATFSANRPDALFVAIDPFFNSRRVQLVQLAARHALPASYPARDYAEAGGLMSYGADIADAWRQVGIYTGRILKGAKPAELPVLQASKFELVINAETARMLGINVLPTLIARADEVIE
jgi:putative tryptophan/tyrosine transport system substrate-binding protein